MNTNEIFEIIPHSGAGDIKFGMTPAQVEINIGAPETTMFNDQHELVEFRSYMNVTYDKSLGNGVYHIGFGHQMENVLYDGVNIFREQHEIVIKKMMELDPEPYLFVGFIVFLNLGITLTGFHDDDFEQKALALFNHDEYQEYIHDMEPFKKVMKEKYNKNY